MEDSLRNVVCSDILSLILALFILFNLLLTLASHYRYCRLRR